MAGLTLNGIDLYSYIGYYSVDGISQTTMGRPTIGPVKNNLGFAVEPDELIDSKILYQIARYTPGGIEGLQRRNHIRKEKPKNITINDIVTQAKFDFSSIDERLQYALAMNDSTIEPAIDHLKQFISERFNLLVDYIESKIGQDALNLTYLALLFGSYQDLSKKELNQLAVTSFISNILYHREKKISQELIHTVKFALFSGEPRQRTTYEQALRNFTEQTAKSAIPILQDYMGAGNILKALFISDLRDDGHSIYRIENNQFTTGSASFDIQPVSFATNQGRAEMMFYLLNLNPDTGHALQHMRRYHIDKTHSTLYKILKQGETNERI